MGTAVMTRRVPNPDLPNHDTEVSDMTDTAGRATGYDPTDPDNAPLTPEELLALEEQDRKFAELRKERGCAPAPATAQARPGSRGCS